MLYDKYKMHDVLFGAKLNDEKCYVSILEDLKPFIYGLASRLFIIGSDPDDFFQEACLKLVSIVKSHRADKGSFECFAKRSIRNHLLDKIKTQHYQKRKGSINTINIDSINERFLADGNDFVSEMIKKEEDQLFWEGISKGLTEEEKNVVFLRVIKGYKLKKVSKLLGMSDRVSEAIYLKGKEKLKKAFYEKGTSGKYISPYINGGVKSPTRMSGGYAEYDPDFGSSWDLGVRILENQ